MSKHENFRDNRLYKLLSDRLPDRFMYSKDCPRCRRHGEGLDIVALAGHFNYSGETVRKWLRADHLPARNARAIIDVSEGRLTQDDLYEFII